MNKLNTLKTLLKVKPDDVAQDDLLEVYLNISERSVLNYINRHVLPRELVLTVVRLAAESLKALAAQEADEAGEGKVSSVTMPGSMSISYGADKIDTMLLQAALNDRIPALKELNSFRLVIRPPAPLDNGWEDDAIGLYFEIDGETNDAYFQIDDDVVRAYAEMEKL